MNRCRLAPVALFCLLVMWAGCKAKMNSDLPDDTPDLSVESCENMKCVDPSFVCCSGEPCVDTTTNSLHCGGCGKSCGVGEACVGSSCVCAAAGNCVCPTDTTCCATGCKGTQSDPGNCGSCGRMCRTTETCSGGSCKCGTGAGCTGTQACCGGTSCADLQSDANNCGMCGKKCAEGKACKSGVCEGECVGCAMPMACCDGKCVNPLNDPLNCGMCGVMCPPIVGAPICLIGKCVVPKDMSQPPDMM